MMQVTLDERYMVPVHIYPGTIVWAIEALASLGTEDVRPLFKAYVSGVLGMYGWYMTDDARVMVNQFGHRCNLTDDEISMCIDEVDHSLVTDMVDYIQQVWAVVLPHITIDKGGKWYEQDQVGIQQ